MTYADEVLADNPSFYWRLNDASGTVADDSTSNGRDGSYNGPTLAQTSITPTDVGTSVDFDGSNDRIETTHAAWQDATTFTVEAIIRPDSVAGERSVMDRRPTTGFPGQSWQFRLSAGKVQFLAFIGNTVTTAVGTSTLAAGTVYHIAATVTPTEVKIYVDGVLESTTALAGATNASTVPLWVGATRGSVAGGSEWFDGRMQHLAHYPTALSAARIAAHADEVYTPATGYAAAASGESDAAADLTTTLALLTGAVAAGQSAAAGDLAVVTVGVTDNKVGGRQRRGSAVATWEPAVVPTPAPYAGARRRDVAHAFSVPVIDGARPVYSVSAAELPGLRDRLVVGGADVTYFRDVPTPFSGYSLEEPLMYGPATITFPQIVACFERPGHGDLSWLRKGAEVLIQRVDPDTETVVATDYVGVVIDLDVAGATISAAVGGEAQGRLALVNRQVPIWSSFQDIGRYAYSAFKEPGGLRLTPYLGPETGIRMQRFGGQSVLDYINEILARAWNREGNQWTIMPVDRGVYEMTRKDTTTIHGTVYADDTRTVASLHRAASEEPNRIFMTGVTPAGQRVRFGVYPGLRQSPPAPYPMDDDSPFGVGTTNGDTDTGDGITVMIGRLIVTKYLDQEDTPGGFDLQVLRAIQNLQADAGLNETNNMNPATWRALYDLDVTGYSLRWSHIEPAAQRSVVRKWNRSGTGAIMGRNPGYVGTHLKVDTNIDVGSGFTRDQMRRWAGAELLTEDNWVGTITFNLGALVAGDHTPGTPITTANVMRARDLRPGMNLRLPLFDGGITVHVASCSVDGAGTVTAAVDTRARDAMKVWEVITRNRESRNSPARAWKRDHRSSTMTKDSIGIWDEVGGWLGDAVDLPAHTWVVFPVVAGQEGQVRSLRVTTSPAAEFVTAVFGDTIYADRLTSLIGNPLTKAGSKRWAKETTRDALEGQNRLLYVAGDYENPCGYFPKQKTGESDTSDDPATAPLTGRWEDDAGFPYHTGEHPVLWVAVYADRATTIPRGRLMWNQLEAAV